MPGAKVRVKVVDCRAAASVLSALCCRLARTPHGKHWRRPATSSRGVLHLHGTRAHGVAAIARRRMGYI